jgi:hypothetical protein
VADDASDIFGNWTVQVRKGVLEAKRRFGD